MLKEFKTFLFRGNIVDLAVAVVIGIAFGAVITALVADIITPLIAAIFGSHDFSALTFTINNSTFLYGAFINAVISFVLIAAAVFFVVVKPMNAIAARRAKEEPAPTTRDCPECLSEIPLAARRCAYCTAEVGARVARDAPRSRSPRSASRVLAAAATAPDGLADTAPRAASARAARLRPNAAQAPADPARDRDRAREPPIPEDHRPRALHHLARAPLRPRRQLPPQRQGEPAQLPGDDERIDARRCTETARRSSAPSAGRASSPSSPRHDKKWRVYQESMPGRCGRASSGLYAARHNPAVYYRRIGTASAAATSSRSARAGQAPCTGP